MILDHLCKYVAREEKRRRKGFVYVYKWIKLTFGYVGTIVPGNTPLVIDQAGLLNGVLHDILVVVVGREDDLQVSSRVRRACRSSLTS